MTTKKPLYRAWYQRNSRIEPMRSDIIYRGLPNGNLIGELPCGAGPMPPGECGTLDRRDGGDPFEHAIFGVDGRVIIIERES